MDNQFRGQSIRELANNLAEVHREIEQAKTDIGHKLREKRNTILTQMDKQVQEIKDQILAEAQRKKADQYDFKEREKELNEHLETMTQVAQKIDDDNKSHQLEN